MIKITIDNVFNVGVFSDGENTGPRHNHHNLAKKIAEMCDEITHLKHEVEVLRSALPKGEYEFIEKCVKDFKRQKKKIQDENRKLEKMIKNDLCWMPTKHL